MLSQCTWDKVTESATEKLFLIYETSTEFAGVDGRKIEELIRAKWGSTTPKHPNKRDGQYI